MSAPSDLAWKASVGRPPRDGATGGEEAASRVTAGVRAQPADQGRRGREAESPMSLEASYARGDNSSIAASCSSRRKRNRGLASTKSNQNRESGDRRREQRRAEERAEANQLLHASSRHRNHKHSPNYTSSRSSNRSSNRSPSRSPSRSSNYSSNQHSNYLSNSNCTYATATRPPNSSRASITSDYHSHSSPSQVSHSSPAAQPASQVGVARNIYKNPLSSFGARELEAAEQANLDWSSSNNEGGGRERPRGGAERILITELRTRVMKRRPVEREKEVEARLEPQLDRDPGREEAR